MSVRLNKLLAQRGIGARRKCDALIEAGAVRVNGEVVREPGTRVEPERDRVEVEGRRLPQAPELRYFALNKPVGVISTLDDPEGRRTLREFLPPGARVFPVGRLDADTSGLLILTNDGELAHRLMHPRYGVEKHYRVRVDREPTPRELGLLERGVEFEPGVVSAPAAVRVLERTERGTMLGLSIHEGRYRQVRRMCEAVGLRVLTLHRSGYGPVRLGPLPRGMWRELSAAEVAQLAAASARPRPRHPGPRLTAFDRIQRRAAAERSAERRRVRAERDEPGRRRVRAERDEPGRRFVRAERDEPGRRRVRRERDEPGREPRQRRAGEPGAGHVRDEPASRRQRPARRGQGRGRSGTGSIKITKDWPRRGFAGAAGSRQTRAGSPRRGFAGAAGSKQTRAGSPRRGIGRSKGSGLTGGDSPRRTFARTPGSKRPGAGSQRRGFPSSGGPSFRGSVGRTAAGKSARRRPSAGRSGPARGRRPPSRG